ncbi:MAG: GAF domain-containing sensor histidine kinase [Acidimicrobiales bacterium]
MDERTERVAVAVAAISRAVSTALDAGTLLERAVTALAPTVPVATAALWLGDGDGLQRVATFPRDTEPDATEAPHHQVALASGDRSIGHLAVTAPEGSGFDEGDQALLDIAGIQIAGALERARLFQEVMELERLKSDFIARVSHELRTPITIINGFLETLLVHDDLDPEQRRHMLQRSQTASHRLSSLIEELLLLSRLDAGVLTPNPREVRLATVLGEVRSASVEPDQVLLGSPSDLAVTTDPELLVRALGLVVDNAIKYGGTGELTAREVDGWLRIDVLDRGAGFPDDVRDTAFEMFTRSKSSTAPGLGVGLPIARTLVEVLDGCIAIQHDHPGPGALVRLELPIR